MVVLATSKLSILETRIKTLKEMLSTKKNKMEIAISGNVKAGKSTLVNAIFKDDLLCRTGVVRTTTENQIIESELYRIIDTPGINANDRDDFIAKEGYQQSDFFIFAHNIVEGELLAQEINFLKDLHAYFNNDEQFVRNLVVVLTNADQLTEENIELAKEKILEQLVVITSSPLRLFTVDSISYLTALLEGKKLLMEHSKIPELQKYLEEAATHFNQNLNAERSQMNSVKKSEVIEELSIYEKNLRKQLEEASSSIIDINTITNLLKEVEKFNTKVDQLLDVDNIKNKQSLSTYAHIDVSITSLYSSYKYSSSSSAQSAGMDVVREKIQPKAERAYIHKRRELIEGYRMLLPNFAGDESAVAQVQCEIEKELIKLKAKLAPLVTMFNLEEIANSNTTLNVPLQDVSDESAFNQPSSLYSEPFNLDYYIESASWYEPWIEKDYLTEYKSGFFGGKNVEKYKYCVMDVRDEMQKHLDSSCKSANATINSSFLRVYRKYENEIRIKVNKIISAWHTSLEKYLNAGVEVKKKQQAQITSLEMELARVESLKQDVQAM